MRLVNFLDDPCELKKNAVVGICEAVEELIEDHETAELFSIDAADSKDLYIVLVYPFTCRFGFNETYCS